MITDNPNKIKEISITEFPKNIFIELPDDYRDILFQLIFLKFKTAENIKSILRQNNLRENVFRWRRGHDKGFPQYINLESFLCLFDGANIARSNIQNLFDIVSRADYSNKRVEKTKELVSLIKDVRKILKGNSKIAGLLGINDGTLRSYISNSKMKSLPSNSAEKLLRFIEQKILCFSFSVDELQNKIISYRGHHGKAIKTEFCGKRKLPIKVTPEFESILFHLFGDGHVKAIGSGEYTQLKIEGRQNFLKKLYNVFGYFDVTDKSFDDGRVIIPKAIIMIISHYYNIGYKKFLGNVAKLPLNLGDGKDFKIAGLSAFIVDEGHVSDRGIEIYSSNKDLLAGIRNLALNLGLDCSDLIIKKAYKNTKQSYRFRIRKKSSIEFVQMVEELKKKYPNCGLAQKEVIIKSWGIS
jgi:hypothetical protein